MEPGDDLSHLPHIPHFSHLDLLLEWSPGITVWSIIIGY